MPKTIPAVNPRRITLRAIQEELGRCLASVQVNKDSRFDLYGCQKGLVIVNVLRDRDEEGPSFEVYVPLTTDPGLDATLVAVKEYLR